MCPGPYAAASRRVDLCRGHNQHQFRSLFSACTTSMMPGLIPHRRNSDEMDEDEENGSVTPSSQMSSSSKRPRLDQQELSEVRYDIAHRTPSFLYLRLTTHTSRKMISSLKTIVPILAKLPSEPPSPTEMHQTIINPDRSSESKLKTLSHTLPQNSNAGQA